MFSGGILLTFLQVREKEIKSRVLEKHLNKHDINK